MTAVESTTSRDIDELAGGTQPPVTRLLIDRSGAPLARLLHDRVALVGLSIAAIFALGALLAPLLTDDDPTRTDFTHRFLAPSVDHPLGTDNLGRDVFARILYGGRLSLGMAVTASVGIALLGLLLGLVAGLYGRAADAVIMRVVDVLLALPTLILALVLVGLLGQGLRSLTITIIAVQWPRYARLVRGMTLKLREQDFVLAARALGASRARIMLRHIAPNLIGPVVVFSTIDMGSTLLAVSGLSFLGFGVGPPTPEWGAMLSEARQYLDRAPELLVYPGVAISVVVLGFNLAGDGLRDMLDPRSDETAYSWDRPARRRRRWRR